MRSLSRLAARAALPLIVAVMVAPAAHAASSGAGTTCHQYCPATHAPEAAIGLVTPPADDGFRWLDGAIGAGVALGGMLIALGVVSVRRRVCVGAGIAFERMVEAVEAKLEQGGER